MEHKILNGLCVPITTPDNFFELENKRWIEKQKAIAEVIKAQKAATKTYYAMTSGLIEEE